MNPFPTSSPQPYPRLQKSSSNSPYKTAKFKQHYRPSNHSRSRSRSPNRSFSQNNSRINPNLNANLNNQSHNSSTIHSQYLWNVLQQTQLFPTLCVEMLKNQQRNILEFKKSINKEKNRVNAQIQSFVVQINHTVQDYRLSLIAYLDRIYQQYISKYSQLKSQILNINRLKQQIQSQYSIREPQSLPRTTKTQNLSNLHTIKTIQQNQNQLKKYQIIQYIAQLQKQKIIPLNQMAQQLMILTQYDNGYFQPQEFKNYIGNIRDQFRSTFKNVLEEIYVYVRDPDNIVFKEIGRRKDSQKVLSDLDRQKSRDQLTLNKQFQGSTIPVNYPRNASTIPQQMNMTYNFYSQREPIRDPRRDTEISLPKAPINPPGTKSQPYLTFQNDSQIMAPMRGEYSQQQFKTRVSQPPNLPMQPYQTDRYSKVASSYRQPLMQPQQYSIQFQSQPQNQQQSYKNTSFSLPQQPKLHHPQVLQYPQKITSQNIRISQQNIPLFSFKSKAMDVILCALCLENNLIAVGSKDGSLVFYQRNGNVIKYQQNVHKSAVCTLSTVFNGRYLASGSDHPNPQIIIWNLNPTNLQPLIKLKQHKGAVTAISCLLDNEHIISGSYDKRLCVYSLLQQKLKYTLPSNKYSVTALTLNCTGNKLISCCLENNSLNVWQIVRANNNNNNNNNNINNSGSAGNLDGNQGVLGKVQTIFLEQVVQNGAMICSMVSSSTRPNIIYIGTKDGKVKIVDIQRSQSIKSLSCCNNALIQMLVIEQNQVLPLILCWPCKQKCFKIIDCENGKVTNINTRGQLDFSCGVGPKATAVVAGGRGADDGFAVCSQADDREIYWYRINRVI